MNQDMLSLITSSHHISTGKSRLNLTSLQLLVAKPSLCSTRTQVSGPKQISMPSMLTHPPSHWPALCMIRSCSLRNLAIGVTQWALWVIAWAIASWRSRWNTPDGLTVCTFDLILTLKNYLSSHSLSSPSLTIQLGERWIYQSLIYGV